MPAYLGRYLRFQLASQEIQGAAAFHVSMAREGLQILLRLPLLPHTKSQQSMAFSPDLSVWKFLDCSIDSL